MLNRTQVDGNIGKIESGTTQNGKKWCRFTVAYNEKVKNAQGEYEQETTWFNCTAWGQTAEFAEKYLQKGKMCFVEGKMKFQKFTDKNGVEQNTHTILVTNCFPHVWPDKVEQAQPTQQPTPAQQSGHIESPQNWPTTPQTEDDLPF